MYAAPTRVPERPSERATFAMSGDEPAIDLVHLARQTDGDVALEAELLSLFDRQAANLLEQLAAEGAARALCADIAHKLRGSAVAIGAGRVASAAQTLETLSGRGHAGEQDRERALAGLAGAVAEARAAIAAWLG